MIQEENQGAGEKSNKIEKPITTQTKGIEVREALSLANSGEEETSEQQDAEKIVPLEHEGELKQIEDEDEARNSAATQTTEIKIDESRPQPRRTWSEVLAGNRDAGKGLKLDYYPPETPGIVEFTEADVKESVEKWKNSLIGAVMGTKVSYYDMERFIAAR